MINKCRLALFFICITSSFFSFSQKNTREYIKEANKTSLSWLINMNKGDLAKCYGIIAKEAKELGYDSLSWCSFAQQITKEFGLLKDRVLVNGEFKREMEGMEDGFYVILDYKTIYENTSKCKETLILKQNDQANWRIFVYTWEVVFKEDEDPVIEK